MSISKPRQRRTTRVAEPDWAALDTMTDRDITAQIATNPDAAPDVSDWSLDDPSVVVMQPMDVKQVRAKLGLSQQDFAREFGLNLAALRDWEQQRRVPRGPARTLLRIIDREPDAARRAVRSSPPSSQHATGRMVEEVKSGPRVKPTAADVPQRPRTPQSNRRRRERLSK